MSVFIGTSGFAYPSWKPAFYPADLPAKAFLRYYAEHLTGLEINYTFRRLATATLLKQWMSQTPAHFRFAPKAHTRITHIDKLKDTSGFLTKFLESLVPLREEDRLGPVLFQLAPSFRCDPGVLSTFLGACRSDYQYAFEFRHNSWFCEDIYSILREHKAAVCIAESEDLETPQVYTGSFGYFRMRRPPYSEAQIQQLADLIKQRPNQLRDVYVFFKHEDDPGGVLDAQALLRVLS